VCDSIERLLTTLGARFDDLRPGVLLSQARSIEADRAAFSSDDARGEVFPDVIAMIDDVQQTLRDLLAAFPIVRRIEAERLALDLDRYADAVQTIREQMDAIQSAAALSEAVTEESIAALAQNDGAIEDATDPVVRTSLVADKLLVFRNFGAAVVGGIASYGRIALSRAGKDLIEPVSKSWEAIKDELPKGIGALARVGPLLLLADHLANPYTQIAVGVAAFSPIASALKKAIADGLRDAPANKRKRPKEKKRGKSL
jgi:hypothetical protein